MQLSPCRGGPGPGPAPADLVLQVTQLAAERQRELVARLGAHGPTCSRDLAIFIKKTVESMGKYPEQPKTREKLLNTLNIHHKRETPQNQDVH